MNYIKLKEPYALRGWDKLPYAVINTQTGEPIFMKKDQFETVIRCDGQTEFSDTDYSQEIVTQGITDGYLENLTVPDKELKPYQRYKKADCRFIRSVNWAITGECNLRCRHCYEESPSGLHGEMPFERCMEIINRLDAANVPSVCLTGGEPLVRKDFWGIVDALTEKNIAILALKTNGVLVDDAFLSECKKRNLSWLFQLSFDGVGCHDWMRGVEGAEEKTIDAIKRIIKAGYRVKITTALHGENISSFLETYKLLVSLGVEIWRIGLAMDVGCWKNETEKKKIETSDLLNAYLSLLRLYKADQMPLTLSLLGAFHCVKGSGKWSIPFEKYDGTEKTLDMPICETVRMNLNLQPNGVLLPCMGAVGSYIEEQAPNILDTPLTEIMRPSSAFFSLIDIRIGELFAKNETCGNCEFRLRCCRCPYTAFVMEGDLFGVDRFACFYFHNNCRSKIEEIMR